VFILGSEGGDRAAVVGILEVLIISGNIISGFFVLNIEINRVN
jgi:hypothetical protein